MSRYVRVKLPVTILRHPEGYMVVPNPAQPYADDDPLVKAFPWQFEADVDRDTGPVENARANPGERRPTYRR
jgi:hypothetical protein